ncbi:hypothetical protein GWK41_09315 [Persephonella atlantica]|uniref:Uncharacterized protein n=1 Tax=Persephonella atlantica TaxID=2699429 RepID=A0ABS1GK02_9AQUI|nr:hypothetical protein [Persephonella atlantica]MBK3333268.1 hypothetical protein [Persephonella atlantica]
MNITELEKKIETLSHHYCSIISKTDSYIVKEQMFRAFYETILLIQQMHLDQICRECKNRKKVPQVF